MNLTLPPSIKGRVKILSRLLTLICLGLFAGGCASTNSSLWQPLPTHITVKTDLKAAGDDQGVSTITIPAGTYTFWKQVSLGYVFTCGDKFMIGNEPAGLMLSNRADKIIPVVIILPDDSMLNGLGQMEYMLIDHDIKKYGCALRLEPALPPEVRYAIGINDTESAEATPVAEAKPPLPSIEATQVVETKQPGPSLEDFQKANDEVEKFLADKLPFANVHCCAAPTPRGYFRIWVNGQIPDVTPEIRSAVEDIFSKDL
jgi:hypothetical protein